jgi:uncharacterized membrane protein
MRSSKMRMLIGLVAVVAVLGLVILGAIHYGDVGRRPWLPIGIALIAAGAVGAVVLTTIAAMRTEDAMARRSPRPQEDADQKNQTS